MFQGEKKSDGVHWLEAGGGVGDQVSSMYNSVQCSVTFNVWWPERKSATYIHMTERVPHTSDVAHTKML